MNYQPPPKPPFNDQLYKALSPLQQTVDNKSRIEGIMKKYGRQAVKDQPAMPPVQWQGDNNA